MSAMPKVDQLLDRIRIRLLVRKLASRSFLVLILLASAYAVALLTGRLTGMFPDYFAPWTVAALPVAALMISLVLPGRPTRQDAARAADRHQNSKDLFLTFTLLDGCPLEYAPLVGRDAERACGKVLPEQVVPYHWEHRMLTAAGMLGVLLLGAFLVPTLDPFGHVAVAKEAETTRKLLQETKNQTEARKAQLAQKDVEKENSDEVEKAVESLKTGFQQLKKGEQKPNLEKLNAHQKELGEMYRKLNSGELKSLFDKMQGEQQFGQLHNQDEFRQWQKDLQEGKSDKLEQKLDSLKESMEQLAATKDPVKKSELQRQIQKQLKQLSDFSSNKTGSKALTAALQRAMEQLEAAQQEGLSKEAMEALKESLDVAKMEAGMLAQSSRDLKTLEEALQVISMAKQLNAKDQLDGDMVPGEMTLEDYAELYAELMGMQSGDGGEGTGGRGMGGGAKVDEDDSVATDFVNEKSKSAIQQGKILLSMKTKGLSEAGDVKDENYKRIVGEIRQSLEDVINQEEIPPGYVEGIKKYFDSLDKSKAE